MSKITAFVDRCVNDKGYSRSDFICEGSPQIGISDHPVLLYKTRKLQLPVDLSALTKDMDASSADYAIVYDLDTILIFRRKDGGITEVDDLPDIADISESETFDIENSSRLQDIIDVISSGPHRFEVVEAILVAAARQRDSEFRNYIDSSDVTIDELIDKLTESTGISAGRLSKFELSDLREYVNMFDSVDFKPSVRLAEVICGVIEHDRDIRVPGNLVQSLISIMPDKTEIFCNSPIIDRALLSKNTKFDVMVSSAYSKASHDTFNFQAASIVGYFAGSVSIVDDAPFRKYTSIIVVPPIGYHSNETMTVDYEGRPVIIRSEEESYLLNSISRLEDGGRLVALMSPHFMFRSSDVRAIISSDYRVSAIVKLKTPLTGISIDMYVLVIDKCESSKTVVLRDDVKGDYKNEFSLISKAIESCSDDDRFRAVDQSALGDMWTIESICAPESEICEGTKLEDLFDFITGVAVKPADYFPEGSVAGIPYLRVSNITDNGIDMRDAVHVPSTKVKSTSLPGDIVISVSGTIGKIAQVKCEFFAPSPQIVILRPKSHEDSDILFNRLKSSGFGSRAVKMATGTTFKHLSLGTLRRMVV